MNFDFFECKFVCDIEIEGGWYNFKMHFSKPFAESNSLLIQTVFFILKIIPHESSTIPGLQKILRGVFFFISLDLGMHDGRNLINMLEMLLLVFVFFRVFSRLNVFYLF